VIREIVPEGISGGYAKNRKSLYIGDMGMKEDNQRVPNAAS